jgi:hypothetical protein
MDLEPDLAPSKPRWRRYGRYHPDLEPLRQKARREGKEAELDPDRIALAHASFLEEQAAKRAGKLPEWEWVR